ncbi:hypothetical protein OAL03_05025 [Akkermansiaceae bacterium]|nr:hypothetical protein [Akkermansiaceae bacterium]
MSKDCVFTVCNVGYLSKALALSESLKSYEDKKLKIFLFDKKRKLDFKASSCEITWIEDIAPHNFFQLAFKYNVIELTTAFKPFIGSYLSEFYEKVIFFDPDILLFDNLSLIYDTLENDNFLLTPHISEIEYNPDLNLNYQKFGFYNLGFFAFKSNNESREILEWWWRQCESYCFDETHQGAFTDQKWMSLGPFYFTEIKVLRDVGLNVAWWNLHEREVSFKEGRFVVRNSSQQSNLIFFHFSAFGGEDCISKKSFNLGGNKKTTLSKLSTTYLEFLHKSKVRGQLSYSYDFREGGMYINPVLRRAYASKFKSLEEVLNPFGYNDLIDQFIGKNYLISRNTKNNSHIGNKEKNRYLFPIRIYFMILRFVLKISGPNNFMALNRLITYSSSLIRSKDYWKL